MKHLLLISAGFLSMPLWAVGQQPNVVIINLDDVGYGDFSYSGARGYQTPNIDQLAANGMRFTQFLAVQPVSGASRAGLLTGCYPNRIGFHGAPGTNNPWGIHPDEMTMGELVRQVGYSTAVFGKWHLGDSRCFLPLQNGFDEYYGLPYSNDMWPYHPQSDAYGDLPTIKGNEVVGYNTDQTQFTTDYTNYAVQFIQKNSHKPFLLYLAHSMPHVPLAVSDKFKGKSKQGLYGDVMMEIDWSVGEVLKTLRSLGIEENTMVILTSDNGPWLNYGNHAGSTLGLRQGKGTTFEGGNRVPCVIYWKGVTAPGTTCNSLLSNIDIFPTVAEITGAPLPDKKIDGVSMLALIKGNEADSPRDNLVYYYGKNNLEAVTNGDFKLIYPHQYRDYASFPPGNDGMPGKLSNPMLEEPQLFDLRRDPGERYNIYKEYPEIVEQLDSIAEKYREELGDDLTGRSGKERREPGLLIAYTGTDHKTPLILRYDTPADNWDEALPIGNGRSGAMLFGGVDREQLQLNENTLYSGEPSDVFKDVKIAPEMFDKVVGLMRSGEYTKASDLVCKNWLGRLHQYYQPFGDLHIQNNKQGAADRYKRTLDISHAVASTAYKQNGIHYNREVFASHPDSVIVIRLKSSAPEGIDVSLNFTSPHPTALQRGSDDRLILHGQAPGYVERRTFEQLEAWGDQYKHPELYDIEGKRKFDKRVLYGDEIDGKGMFFEAQLKPILPKGGKCEITDSGLHIYQTDEVYFILSMATSFNGFDKSPSREGVDPSAKASGMLDKALSYDYQTLKQRHTSDYRSLFDRVDLRLISSSGQKALPTDKRIEQFAHTADPDLAALLFQFGRYLMISGSRPGGQPLNLQGIWNKDTIPAWNSGYTININTEMNYWPAELTNLSECQQPLFRMIRELAVSGAETARNMYNRRGWVAHHNTSIWRESLPNDNVPTASFWPMVQGWLCSHLWEHYLFTQDETFLREEAYPLMKGAAEFFADWLIDDGNGQLVTPVGVSPENLFITEDGQTAAMSMGTTMDMAIIRETFSRTIETAEKFDIDRELREELKEKLSHLLPYRIGKQGQLQEWMHDFKERDPQHRHFSHLYGFHPSDQITPDRTPELFNAVRKTLELRGDLASGWSMGWKINCWARLLDGNHAYKIITNLFNPIGFGSSEHKGGGLFRNMLCAHPPFQIDGNFGYTAGVTEMLLQSHAGYIHLLPALPDVWPEGYVSGLKARGNFEVTMDWKGGELTGAKICSLSGKSCTLRTQQPFTIREGSEVIATATSVRSDGKEYYQVTFGTQKGKTYAIAK